MSVYDPARYMKLKHHTHIHASLSDSWLRELHLGDRSFLWAFGSVRTIITNCRNRWLWVIAGKCFPLKLYSEVSSPKFLKCNECPISPTFFRWAVYSSPSGTGPRSSTCFPCFPHYPYPAQQSLLRPQLPGQGFCFPFCLREWDSHVYYHIQCLVWGTAPSHLEYFSSYTAQPPWECFLHITMTSWVGHNLTHRCDCLSLCVISIVFLTIITFLQDYSFIL